jgi:hypothetical protein
MPVRPPSDQLSRDPRQIRNRMRRRTEPLAEDVEMLASSRKPIEEWDLEELARGRPRSSAGDFRGRPPTWITPAVRTEAQRRLKLEAHAYMSGHISDAIKVLADLMVNSPDEKIQLDCAKFIIEHTVGKAVAKVDVELGGGVRELLANRVVTRDLETGQLVDAHPVIDITSDEWTDEEDVVDL